MDFRRLKIWMIPSSSLDLQITSSGWRTKLLRLSKPRLRLKRRKKTMMMMRMKTKREAMMRKKMTTKKRRRRTLVR